MGIFLGTPITCLLEKNNLFSESNKMNLKKIISSLREKNEVFCAIEREKWGEELLSGEVCTILDYEAMQNCDTFIAIPNNSYGVYMELGWASSLGKNIIVLINRKFGIKSPLIEGIFELSNFTLIEYDDEHEFPSEQTWNQQLLKLINESLVEFDCRKEVAQ